MLFEIALIFLLCFLYAGTPAPDVNEAHYLSRAKHLYQPDWCSGDLFLESRDAHGVFVRCVGWATQFVSLPVLAWIGRVITWLLLAVSWWRLSWSVAPQRYFSVLSAAIAICLWNYGHMAGEWVVGGFEAKGFAFALVFVALERIVRGSWRSAWVLMGCASSLHVLVGGWALIASVVAYLCEQVAYRFSPGTHSGNRSLTKDFLALSLAGVCALPGLLPALALNRGVDAKTVSYAHQVYVYHRLSHHVLPQKISLVLIFRFVGLSVLWAYAWKRSQRSPGFDRLNAVVLASLLLAGAGTLIDRCTWTRHDIGAALLRFYWFRLSDVMVPLGAALLFTRGLTKTDSDRSGAHSRWLALAILTVSFLIGQLHLSRIGNPYPNGFLQGLGREMLQRDQITEKWLAWQDVCDWARQNTRYDTRFLTPKTSQTFKWYAERPEAATWKDTPQDAQAIREWWETLQRITRSNVYDREEDAATEDLLALARDLQFRYLVIEQATGRTEGPPNASLPLAYENEWFRVHYVPERQAAEHGLTK